MPSYGVSGSQRFVGSERAVPSVVASGAEQRVGAAARRDGVEYVPSSAASGAVASSSVTVRRYRQADMTAATAVPAAVVRQDGSTGGAASVTAPSSRAADGAVMSSSAGAERSRGAVGGRSEGLTAAARGEVSGRTTASSSTTLGGARVTGSHNAAAAVVVSRSGGCIVGGGGASRGLVADGTGSSSLFAERVAAAEASGSRGISAQAKMAPASGENEGASDLPSGPSGEGVDRAQSQEDPVDAEEQRRRQEFFAALQTMASNNDVAIQNLKEFADRVCSLKGASGFTVQGLSFGGGSGLSSRFGGGVASSGAAASGESLAQAAEEYQFYEYEYNQKQASILSFLLRDLVFGRDLLAAPVNTMASGFQPALGSFSSTLGSDPSFQRLVSFIAEFGAASSTVHSASGSRAVQSLSPLLPNDPAFVLKPETTELEALHEIGSVLQRLKTQACEAQRLLRRVSLSLFSSHQSTMGAAAMGGLLVLQGPGTTVVPLTTLVTVLTELTQTAFQKRMERRWEQMSKLHEEMRHQQIQSCTAREIELKSQAPGVEPPSGNEGFTSAYDCSWQAPSVEQRSSLEKKAGNGVTFAASAGGDDKPGRGQPNQSDRSTEEKKEDKKARGFEAVVGLESVKQSLREMVILPVTHPELFQGPLRSPSRGLLLYGPPGNGKTFLARAVANEADCAFFPVSASSLTGKYFGESEKIVRDLFKQAAEKSPAVIFFDEIDSILSKRGFGGEGGENEASRRLKTEFLVQFDGSTTNDNAVASSHQSGSEGAAQADSTGGLANGNPFSFSSSMGGYGAEVAKRAEVFPKKKNVIVIAATNRPMDLDEAVLRRFPKRIFVPLPEFESRKNIVLKLLVAQYGSMKRGPTARGSDSGPSSGSPKMRVTSLSQSSQSGYTSRSSDASRCSSAEPHALAVPNTQLTNIELKWLVDATDGYSASDLTALCQEAAMLPVRELLAAQMAASSGRGAKRGRKKEPESVFTYPADFDGEICKDEKDSREELRPLAFQDFVVALDTVESSVSQENLDALDKWRSDFGQKDKTGGTGVGSGYGGSAASRAKAAQLAAAAKSSGGYYSSSGVAYSTASSTAPVGAAGRSGHLLVPGQGASRESSHSRGTYQASSGTQAGQTMYRATGGTVRTTYQTAASPTSRREYVQPGLIYSSSSDRQRSTGPATGAAAGAAAAAAPQAAQAAQTAQSSSFSGLGTFFTSASGIGGFLRGGYTAAPAAAVSQAAAAQQQSSPQQHGRSGELEESRTQQAVREQQELARRMRGQGAPQVPQHLRQNVATLESALRQNAQPGTYGRRG